MGASLDAMRGNPTRCGGAVNVRGEHWPCDQDSDHGDLAHNNQEHGAIWLPDAPQKVYVLEMGCYEDRHVAGIYTSAEAAMAGVKGIWVRDDFRDRECWQNDLDWGDAARVMEYGINVPR